MKIVTGFKQDSISSIKLKVLRFNIDKEYFKVDIGFTYGENNILNITDDIILYSETSEFKLIKSTDLEINTDVVLKSKIDYKYFSLYFEPLLKNEESLFLYQEKGTDISIIISNIVKYYSIDEN